MQACLHVEDGEDWWDSSVVPNDTVSFVDDDQDFVRVESGMIGESPAEVLTASETFVRVREGTKGWFIIAVNMSIEYVHDADWSCVAQTFCTSTLVCCF